MAWCRYPDVYAFGVLAYEVMTGLFPFAGMSDLTLTEHMRNAGDAWTCPRVGWVPDTPRAVFGLIEECWAPRKVSRPTFSMADLTIALGILARRGTADSYLSAKQLIDMAAFVGLPWPPRAQVDDPTTAAPVADSFRAASDYFRSNTKLLYPYFATAASSGTSGGGASSGSGQVDLGPLSQAFCDSAVAKGFPRMSPSELDPQTMQSIYRAASVTYTIERGDALVQEGLFNEARAEFTKALETLPANPATAGTRARILLKRGWAHFREGFPTRAEREARAAHALAPDPPLSQSKPEADRLLDLCLKSQLTALRAPSGTPFAYRVKQLIIERTGLPLSKLHTQSDAPDTCWECHCKTSRPPMSRCGQCHVLPYCSVACQTVDWPRHKISECADLKLRASKDADVVIAASTGTGRASSAASLKNAKKH